MKYALFDCDGTLLDSMPMWINLATDVLATYGVDLPREAERQTASMTHEDAAKFYADTFLNGVGAETLEKTFSETLTRNYRERLTFKPHVREVLDALHEKGVPMAVASSTDAYLLEMCLKRLGVRDYFRFVQTVDNTGFSKNSDAYFVRAAEQMGCAPGDIVFFDDALYALERAKNNGFITVAVKDDTQMDHNDRIRAISDHYIEDFSEINIDEWFFGA